MIGERVSNTSHGPAKVVLRRISNTSPGADGHASVNPPGAVMPLALNDEVPMALRGVAARHPDPALRAHAIAVVPSDGKLVEALVWVAVRRVEEQRGLGAIGVNDAHLACTMRFCHPGGRDRNGRASFFRARKVSVTRMS